jgi:hypothetical protein
VRVAGGQRRWQTDEFEKFGHPGRPRFLTLRKPLYPQGLRDRAAHPVSRVQRRERILEDQADPAAQRFLRAAADTEHIVSIQWRNPRVGLDQSGECRRDGRLARTRFAHQPQGGAPPHLERKIFHRIDAGPARYALGYRVVDSPLADMHTTPIRTPVIGSAWHGDNHVESQVAQLYGGYVLPGSRFDSEGGIGLVVSQWNTTTGWPYRAMQFKAALRDTTKSVHRTDPIKL